MPPNCRVCGAFCEETEAHDGTTAYHCSECDRYYARDPQTSA